MQYIKGKVKESIHLFRKYKVKDEDKKEFDDLIEMLAEFGKNREDTISGIRSAIDLLGDVLRDISK